MQQRLTPLLLFQLVTGTGSVSHILSAVFADWFPDSKNLFVSQSKINPLLCRGRADL